MGCGCGDDNSPVVAPPPPTPRLDKHLDRIIAKKLRLLRERKIYGKIKML